MYARPFIGLGFPRFERQGALPPSGSQRLSRQFATSCARRLRLVGRRFVTIGKPMASLLLAKNATVTIAHSRTRDLAAVCREADILVAAVGRAKMITKDFVKPGAAVIDVGMNRDENGKLCGDVDFADVESTVGVITPVPGGVGPMTIAMLLSNTLRAALAREASR